MTQQIHAVRFDIEDIGKHVKGSKKRFSWTFGLNGRNHTIILDFSFISGKVKLVVDRKTMLESELPTSSSFQHPFTLDGFAINILQQGQTFQLRINNKVFSHLYNQAKTNTQFKNYEDEVKDIKVNQSSFQNTGKTVKLNIGALDGGKKKTKNTAQSENWGNLGGNDSGIPSYFGQAPSKATQSIKVQQKKASLLDSDQQQSTSKSSNQQKKVQTKKSGQIDFFANQNQNNSLTSPSQQHLQNISSQAKQQQFNTMQNMFATMNIQNQPVNKAPQQSSLSLLDSSINQPNVVDQFNTMQNMFATQAQNPNLVNKNVTLVNQNPLASNMNTNDFNTMQNLFATQEQNPSLANKNLVGINQNPVSINQANNDFNTMQNLFATGVQNQNFGFTSSNISMGQANVSLNNPVSFPPPSQFNTMQNLFATQNPGAVGVTIQNNPQGIANFPNPDQFNTMQNMFKTVNQTTPIANPNQITLNTGGMTMAQLQSNTGNLNSAGNDFNTMQNLFATSNNPNTTGNVYQQQVQQTVNTQNANIQDFNTMQNLFKTGGVSLNPPATIQTKKQDPFALLGQPTPVTVTQKIQISTTQYSPNQVTFNTYSGTKTTNASSIDMASFGTMQKGQLGNIDFFAASSNPQVQPTQPISDVPNFSKKKQPQEQDLI